MEETEKNDLISALSNSGFPLENDVLNAFEKKGWAVEGSQYYVDDVTGQAREIDITAWKSKRVSGIIVYTKVIVSCKHSSSKRWVFLVRDFDGTKPEWSYEALQYATNVPPLRSLFTTHEFGTREYVCETQQAGSSFLHLDINKNTFAQQEVDTPINVNKVYNDKAIYDSVTTLIKSQHYGTKSIEKIKYPQHSVFCQVNLLTVFSGEIYEVDYSFSPPNVVKTGKCKYMFQNIAGGSPTKSKIDIVSIGEMDSILNDYDNLHEANCSAIQSIVEKNLSRDG